MSENLRVCRKCLIRASSKEDFFRQLEAYISGLAEEDRVDQETYERRLSICNSCENLMEGMCRLCGCYVELRAALKVRRCPSLPARWEPAVQRVSL